jgi:hypothetical protein
VPGTHLLQLERRRNILRRSLRLAPRVRKPATITREAFNRHPEPLVAKTPEVTLRRFSAIHTPQGRGQDFSADPALANGPPRPADPPGLPWERITGCYGATLQASPPTPHSQIIGDKELDPSEFRSRSATSAGPRTPSDIRRSGADRGRSTWRSGPHQTGCSAPWLLNARCLGPRR